MNNATLCKIGEKVGETECKGNSIDGSKAVYALTFNEAGNSPLYAQGNKIAKRRRVENRRPLRKRLGLQLRRQLAHTIC
jgi:hypothetical protein